jgi:hypothetical protein
VGVYFLNNRLVEYFPSTSFEISTGDAHDFCKFAKDPKAALPLLLYGVAELLYLFISH